ncbi:MAG: DUF2867 domain-containing protein, partial [Thermoleophilia bacterium]|nr:DUF2867 domain-containing protein [Thermoleophilia bacterium]
PGKLAGRSFADHPHVEVVRGDVCDADSLDIALVDVDVAYYLVHSMSGSVPDFHAADLKAARTFGAACQRAGVARIVYLSGLGAEDDDQLSEHLQSRHETGVALAEAGVPVTELRAAIVVGSGSASFEIIRDLVRKLPVMVTPRWVNSLCEPIAIRDVVTYLIRVLDEPRTIGEVLEIGSGEQLTYATLMKVLAEEMGRKVYIYTVPILTPRLSSYWLHLVTSVDVHVARPLVEGLRNDVICTDRRITEWIPIERSPYRLAVHRALDKVDAPTMRESRWTDADSRRARVVMPVEPPKHRVRIAPNRNEWRDYHTFDTDLSADELFEHVEQLGGANGYGRSVDFLWRIRGRLDRVVGGTGLRRGRPFGTHLHPGDAVDFWRVERVRKGRELQLVAEMLVPGVARLSFRIEPLDDGGSRLHQLATLSNASLLSGLYWIAIAPLHNWVFNELGEHVVGAGHLRQPV